MDVAILGTSATKAELVEALRTALSRNARLSGYRHSQTRRLILLQQQLDSTNLEMDASVDALRLQRSKAENERQRSTLEARDLRNQLAEAQALLQKACKNGFTADHRPITTGSSPNTASKRLQNSEY